MLADRVRMGSGGKKDMVLYNKGNIYAEYGRTKNFSYSDSRGKGTITFNSDHFHMYAHSPTDTYTVRTMVGFKLPPNLPTNAKILVKYFDCNRFEVSLAPSIEFLNSRETLSLLDAKIITYLSGTGEITLELGDTTGYEVVGVRSMAFNGTDNLRFEKLEVII